MKRSLFAAATAFVAAAFISTAYAEFTLPIEGVFDASGAKGEVRVEEGRSRSDLDEITVEVSGLMPGSVYTVWLAREDPARLIKGLGVDDHSFTTDSAGSGRFSATVYEGELNRWDMIEIAYHPNGDPGDLDNAQTALRGDLGVHG